MHTSLALVHHANQYLITTGYDNREGLDAVVGDSRSGLTGVLCLHERLGIPMNLHISGTLIEAIAWHQPEFLARVRGMIAARLIEIVGSSYGQNIMRFFGPDYNRRQLNEELFLYLIHLGVDPAEVKVFWPPERVWETRRMAPVLCDPDLLNSGYHFVILDDRLLHRQNGPTVPREEYDRTGFWSPELFQMHEIEGANGLIAFPIATRLRRSIPPRQDEDWTFVRTQLEALLVYEKETAPDLLAIYADDMEKVAGIGEWGGDGLERYSAFLEWVAANGWVKAVRLSEWAASSEAGVDARKVQLGTFEELAKNFNAGEGYENWYLADDWAPYRGYFEWAEQRVQELEQDGADPSLIELARKQLLVGNWETAWHTPSSGPHGDPDNHGNASPWARALTSHVRHAAVTAQAAHWMRHKDGLAHACSVDIDNDGEEEIVLKNDRLFAVISPRWGGRVVALFDVGGESGAMLVGNPCDDWNWMEELNRYMDVPRNHPGAFADAGFEHDEYTASIIESDGNNARVQLQNIAPDSSARGMRKEFLLEACAGCIDVRYTLPPGLESLETEFGLSPDYLNLLRGGAGLLRPIPEGTTRGFQTASAEVWVSPDPLAEATWLKPYQEKFGHGRTLRLGCANRDFTVSLGVGPCGGPSRSDDSLKPEMAQK